MLSKSCRIAVCVASMLCFPLSQAAEEEEKKEAYTFEGMYRLDYWTGITGPLKTQVNNVGLLDLRLNVDGEKAWNWKGGRMLLQAQGTHGNYPNQVQGTVQGIDNAEVEVNTTRIFQAWAEQSMLDDKLSLLFGLFDVNTEFDVTDSSGPLLHPTFGISSEVSQTGLSIFPETALALRAAWNFNEKITLRTALLDAVPGDPDRPRGTNIRLDLNEGTLLISELSYINKANEHDANKVAIGAWRYSGLYDDTLYVDDNGAPIKRANYGLYLLGERTVWRANKEGSRGIDAFLRLGWASPNVNQIDSALGTGLLWRGPFESRPEDKLTFGIAAEHHARKWRVAQAAQNLDVLLAEVAYEISYRAIVKDWFAIQSDFQLVRNHASQGENTDALLAGIRMDFTF